MITLGYFILWRWYHRGGNHASTTVNIEYSASKGFVPYLAALKQLGTIKMLFSM